jgi:sugar lactone lactonase YvrE
MLQVKTLRGRVPRQVVARVAVGLAPWIALGCSGDDKASTAPDAAPVDATSSPADAAAVVDGAAASDATATTDATDAAEASSAVSFISLSQGAPASVFWDDGDQVLYIADDDNNQIWTWTDANGLAKFATTADPDGAALEAGATLVGQVVRLDDGTVVVARFGQPRGGFAAIAYVLPDGGADLVPGVDPQRKHLGVAVGPSGTLFGSYFNGVDGGSAQTGAVTQVDLQVGETDYAPGFGKIIGMVVAGDMLYVSDQQAGAIYRWPVAGPVPEAGTWPVFASLVKPDQICTGPDGTLFTGQFQGAPDSSAPLAVRQIASDGGVSVFKQDPDVSKPSGVAYDPTHHRLFVADTGNSAMIGVHVFPVP